MSDDQVVSTTSNIDEPEVCRACLRPSSQLMSLHEQNCAIRFRDCTNLIVNLNDMLPQSLCQSCYDMLFQCYVFKRLCCQSDKILRQRNQNKINAERALDYTYNGQRNFQN